MIRKNEWWEYAVFNKENRMHKLWIFFNTLRIFLKKRLRYGTMNVKL